MVLKDLSPMNLKQLSVIFILSQVKDTLKALDNFRNKQQVYKLMFFDM